MSAASFAYRRRYPWTAKSGHALSRSPRSNPVPSRLAIAASAASMFIRSAWSVPDHLVNPGRALGVPLVPQDGEPPDHPDDRGADDHVLDDRQEPQVRVGDLAGPGRVPQDDPGPDQAGHRDRQAPAAQVELGRHL